MAPESIKLTVEKHGTKIRYKRQYGGTRWVSISFDSESRENKRQAWAAFVEWRSSRSAPQINPDDPLRLQREIVQDSFKTLAEHAELTGGDASRWRTLIATVPSMDRSTLFEATAFVAGEYNGVQNSAVIEDRAATVERLKDASNSDLIARRLADEYINKQLRKAQNSTGSYGHYGQVKRSLDVFIEWFGSSRSLEQLTEKTIRDYSDHLEDLMHKKTISRNTAFGYQAKFRKWIGDLVEDYPEVPLPKNLRSKSQRIGTERREPNPFTLDEVKLLLNHATPKTRLYLLLMLNCAMYQGDIADLTATEVDWESGRIIRPRSKTARQSLTTGKAQPYKCNWKLWGATWKLFQEFASREGLCFRSEEGNPLIVHSASARTDTIRSAYVRLVKKLKNQGLVPKDWSKTLKQLRKTGANLLEDSEDHGSAYNLYLNHSVAKQSYLTSGKPVPSFDSAIAWLGEQIAVE